MPKNKHRWGNVNPSGTLSEPASFISDDATQPELHAALAATAANFPALHM